MPPTTTPTRTNTPVPPTPTRTPTPPADGTFPTSGILDSFNRANGTIGGNWGGSTGGYRIASNRLDVASGGDVYWRTGSFGATQEAYVTLSSVDANAGEIDVLLKSQSATGWGSGVLEVWYEPARRSVQVWTFAPQQGWVQYGADIPLTLANGDVLGARATADGQVQVYRDATLLGTRDISAWTFARSGGYIGLWVSNGPTTFLDGFGGGNATP